MSYDYFSRKITQSYFRSGKVTSDDDIVYLDLSLSSLGLDCEATKEAIRSKIRHQCQEMTQFLLAESYRLKVRQSVYLDKIFVQLDL